MKESGGRLKWSGAKSGRKKQLKEAVERSGRESEKNWRAVEGSWRKKGLREAGGVVKRTGRQKNRSKEVGGRVNGTGRRLK